MPAPATAAARTIDRHGETMTLIRSGETDLSVKGKRQSGAIEEVGSGTAVQQTFTVKLSPTQLQASSWAVKVPKRTDVLNVDGRARKVLDVRPVRDGDTLALYELAVAG